MLKRITVFAVMFFAVVLLSLSAYAGGVENGGITYSVGYQQIPGKNFQDVWSFSYVAGAMQPTVSVNQLDEDMGLSNLILRISKMSPLSVNKNLLAGIEIGYGLSPNTYAKEWSLPADPALAPATGNFTYIDDNGLSSSCKKSHKEETEVTTIPLLGRIAYKIPLSGNDKIGVKAGLGIGSYIINIKQTLTDSITFISDGGANSGINANDTHIDRDTNDNTLILPATELTIGVDYKLTDSISLEFNGNLSMLGKRSLMSENTEISSPNGTADVYSNLKDGLELGGTAIGLNGGIVLAF